MGKDKVRKNIALFVAMMENEFSIAVLEGAERGAKEFDANLIVLPVGLIDGEYRTESTNRFRYQYNVLNSFLKSVSIDAAIIEFGTICSSVDEARKRAYLSQLGDIPVILLSENFEGHSSVCINNKSGLEEVIRHLVETHNCKKIGFVSGPKNNQDARERLGVYEEVMTEYGLECGEDWVTDGKFSVYCEPAVDALMKRHPDLEALVCANDHMAIGTINYLKKHDIVPGRDVLVTGFDNIPSSILTEPALTTVKADPSQLSYAAVLALNSDAPLKDCEYIDTHMIPRESCGCSMHSGLDENDKTTSIRIATRDKVLEAARRKEFETELGNMNREMLSPQDSEREWCDAVIEVTRKLALGDSYIILYRDYISYDGKRPWIQPEFSDLRGYCKAGEKHIYDKGEYPCRIDTLFYQKFITDENRYNMLVTPLFFRENQYGIMLVRNDIYNLQFAYQMANQISTSLEIVHILNEQEKIKKELELASNSKSQFLANMSHEIRTPINAILGMNEMILRENNDPEIDKYAMNIKNAANSLLSLVNDILDFSKIEAGKMSLVQVEYNLASLINDVMNIMYMRVKDKNLDFILECDETLPSVLYGDDVRLRQILLNIISNAAKYTEKGSVTFSVSGSVNEGYVHVHFSVKDTGIGIREEDLKHLFEKFARIDEKRNRNIEGTGLGMNITLGLLQLMGSSLEVKSEYGVGSEFSFTVRQKIVDKTPLKKPTAENSGDKKQNFVQKYFAPDAKILVVDDIEINRVIISSLLNKSLIQVHDADGGKQCLEKVKNEKYDLILLDHMMPDMDGIETLKEIRKMEGCEYDNLPVIVLTANAVSGSEKMYREAGFNDYISKPVDPEKLDTVLLKHISSGKIIYS